jgi:hypothetical protein
VDRDRLVRVLQNLFGNAERPSEQKPLSEPETTSMKGPSNTPPSNSGSAAVPPLADAPPPDLAEDSNYGSSSRRPGSGPDLTTADGVSGAGIDQLREIIVGGQLREYERRFARMEARLASDLAEIREEVRARFTALEQHVRDEFDSVAVELRATQQSRAVEERRLSESIIDVAKKADDEIGALADQVTSETRDLRVQLREQTKAITDAVERRHAELLELQERDAAELRDGKADRADLSALFMEVALRLRGESVIPETRGSGRG